MSNAGNDHNSSMARVVTTGKDLVALLRDAALLVLAVLLLGWPVTFNTMMTRAGFEEGSIIGFKWKATLVESDQALKAAQATITDLKAQNEELTKVLAEVEKGVSDSALKDQIAKLEADNTRLKVTSSKVAASVEATIALNAPLVEKAQASLSSAITWGVVYGGDTTLEAAKYETETVASKLGIPNTAVYSRQGSFRSVAVLSDRSEAEQILYKAKQRRPDAYLVNMSTWCPHPVDKAGFLECGNA